MNNQVFQYNGQPVTFQLGNGDVMVNATQMAKPFGREVKNYLRLPSTNELITAYVRKNHVSENQLVTVKQGSPEYGGGTWLHEDIALDFAQWLSVDFKLWCNDRIKELLRYGMTATQPTIEAIIDDPDNAIKLLTALKAERAEKERIAAQNEAHKQRLQMVEGEKTLLEQENRQLAPKAEYTDKVLQSTNTYTMTQVAKEFGMSAHAFGNKLRQRGVMFYQSGQWMLTAKYQSRGYTKPRTHHFTHSDGTTGTNTITVWTETGRAFLHSLFGS